MSIKLERFFHMKVTVVLYPAIASLAYIYVQLTCGKWANDGSCCWQVRIARIFNTYGPRMCLDDGRVVSNFVAQVLFSIFRH